MSEPDAAELRRELEELRGRSARRAGFVAQVAHDLRTPLAAVIGSAQTLRRRDGDLTSEQRESLLAVIETEAERLAGLVGEVFDAARIESDGFSYAFAPVDMAVLAAEAVAAARAGREVDVVLHVDGGRPVVRGDGERLRQAIGNLIENAIKYAAGSPVEVEVSAADDAVVVGVADHGDGIAAADQELIFEQYGRIPGTGQPGMGLGLYISRSIVEAHGGVLGVASEPGRGATFSLTLPQA